MKTNLLLNALIFCAFTMQGNAASMFDESGNYSGNWKQMTNVSSGKSTSSYSSSAYSSSAWYANNKKERVSKDTSYSAQSYTQANTVPFRYNTLNYTRVRKVKGGYGDYNAMFRHRRRKLLSLTYKVM